MIDRRHWIGLTAASAALIVAARVSAQAAWPDKPVRIVVGFPAGGASDVLTRMLADKLQAALGQSFVVENRTGAGGNIAMAAVAGAPPDGSTAVSATIGTLSINQYLYSKLGYDPEKDFAYVSTFWENCNVFVVSNEHPARTLAEFRQWAKGRGDKGVTFSSSGVGTTPHLAGELFGLRTGLKVLHVPFRGSASTEVMSGAIDFAIDNVASYTPLLRANRVRALAVTSPDRWPVFPELPTMMEAGVPDFVITSWGAVVMPAGTPAVITGRLSQAMQEVAAQPSMKERFLTAGARITSSTPQETAAFAARERVKWKEVVRLSGAKVD